MTTEYTPAEIVRQKLLPYSARTIRRMILAGEMAARDVTRPGAKQPRWKVSASEIARIKKAT